MVDIQGEIIMNKNRKFLMPLAALAAAFITTNASANMNSSDIELNPTTTQSQSEKMPASSNDVFKFILKTQSQSQVMAYHSSHSSHSSHASHSSHHSGY